MKTSEQIEAINTALAIAQGEFPPIEKTRDNPFFKSKYADLADVLTGCRPVLSKHGLALTQSISTDAQRVIVTTRLLHKSGQWFESELSMKPDKDTAQSVGSTATYARRYSLEAILGIAAGVDDDGNAASQPAAVKAATSVYTGKEEDKAVLAKLFEKHGVIESAHKARIHGKCMGTPYVLLEKIVVAMAKE